MKKNIVVILHLYYHDLWNEFASYLSNIEEPFDLCISLCKDHDNEKIQEIIKKDFPVVRFLIVENVGADIGPFFEWMKILKSENKDYIYLLKIHSKKSVARERNKKKIQGHEWRKKLLEPIVGNKTLVKNSLKVLENDDVGMVCGKECLGEFDGQSHGIYQINQENTILLAKKFKITTKRHIFVHGTMFWIKYKLFKEYLENFNPGIDFFNEPHNLRKGNTTRAHAGERVFGRLVVNKNLKIIGV